MGEAIVASGIPREEQYVTSKPGNDNQLVAEGRLRTAGVSNFHTAHLDRIIAETGIVSAVEQIEAHPYLASGAARAAPTHHALRWGHGVRSGKAGCSMTR